jgi:hypothetical protein
MDRDRTSRDRVAGSLTLAGMAGFALTVGALHVLQPGLSPRDEAVSYYVHGPFGWLLTLGLLSLGAGSLALVAGLAPMAYGRRARIGRFVLAVWALGVLLGAVFPADPRGHWDRPPTPGGMIHGQAALLAFVALPVAAVLLSGALRREERRHARLLAGLGAATAVSLLLFTASLVPVFVRPGPPVLLGLSERALLACYAAWLATSGWLVASPGYFRTSVRSQSRMVS